MNASRTYIMKLIRIRQRLIRQKVSKKNPAEINAAILKLKKWLDFWPSATDTQVRNFLKNNIDAVMTIMPGAKCPAFPKLNEELNQMLYD